MLQDSSAEYNLIFSGCIHHGKPYPNDAIVAIDCYMSSCSKGKWVPTGLPDPKCEFQNEWPWFNNFIKDHTTLFDASPVYNNILPHTENLHIHPMAFLLPFSGCEIGGRKFSEDTEAVVDCYIFKCKDGNWIDTNLMDPDCKSQNHISVCI